MRTIKTLAGTAIELDGDALMMIETMSRDLARRQELDYGFEDVDREIRRLIDQMQEDDLRSYFKEVLFMSFNRYENDRMLAIIKRASQATPDKGKGQRAQAKGQRAKGKGQREKKKIQKGGRQARARRTAPVSRSNRVRRRR